MLSEELVYMQVKVEFEAAQFTDVALTGEQLNAHIFNFLDS